MEFGTKVNIDGVGLRICEDRGSAITEGHIDVYVSSLSAAQNFGRKMLGVKILK
ncbi:3D domain-containing protein [Bacillus infantis]|nr:3D domain-containing protein [Bacillus infantis]